MSKRSRSSSRSPSTGPPMQNRPRSSSPASSITSLGRTKFHHLDPANSAAAVMHCSLPPHRGALSFSSHEDYEVHYLQAHVNRCLECRRNFPTGHFLSLHIEENHDPLIAAKRGRGDKTVRQQTHFDHERWNMQLADISSLGMSSTGVLSRTAKRNAQRPRNVECT